MGYKVIKSFIDLQDSEYKYHVGDDYPRMGLSVSQQRIDELSSNRNKLHIPLIEFVGKSKDKVIEVTNKEVVKDNSFTKTEINRMSTAELKQLAVEQGIENAEEMTGGELKKTLIKHFNL